MQVEAGAEGVTVAKVGEAEIMAENGLKDIFIAYPIIGEGKIKRILNLNRKIRLIVGVDSIEGAKELSEAALADEQIIEVRMEVDTGLRRTGVEYEKAVNFARRIVEFRGIKVTGIFTFKGLVYEGKATCDAEKAGLDEKACSLLMTSGGMSLYLDGVNEILCSDKNKRIVCSQIDELAAKYPKTKILVSDRESSQVSIRMDIPTFLICKLDETMIHEFIHKNSKSKDCEDKINNALKENNYLYNIVKTPFMLETFIGLVEHRGYKKGITNENQLIEVFVKSLIYREANEKKEIRADKIEMLLTYLFVEQKTSEDGRISFTKPGILARFRKCKEHYGFEIDTDEILEIIVQMGFLEKVQGDERYTFANEFYEDYFFNKALLWVEE
jgi:hypothetical protein